MRKLVVCSNLPVLLFLICITITPTSCLAGLSFGGYEWSWSTVSDNGQYVFVVLFPESIEEQSKHIRQCSEDPPYFVHDEEIAEIERLHETYQQTGMYRNDGSTTPLWTTTESVFAGRPSPDGRRLVHFDTNYFFNIDVYEPTGPRREMNHIDMVGLVAFVVQNASGKGAIEIEDCQADANWDHVDLAWDNGATTTVRLDDFAVVQSNTLQYAFFNLFTTLQGIAVFTIAVSIFSGTIYALTRWLMGFNKSATNEPHR